MSFHWQWHGHTAHRAQSPWWVFQSSTVCMPFPSLIHSEKTQAQSHRCTLYSAATCLLSLLLFTLSLPVTFFRLPYVSLRETQLYFFLVKEVLRLVHCSPEHLIWYFCSNRSILMQCERLLSLRLWFTIAFL